MIKPGKNVSHAISIIVAIFILHSYAQNPNHLSYQQALDIGAQAGEETNNSATASPPDPYTTVPGYQGTDTSQTQYYRNSTAIEGAASQAASDSEAAESVRQGHINRPSFTIDPDTDPLIQYTDGIIENPEAIAGSIEAEYSACSVQSQTTAGATETEICHSFTQREERQCERRLDVQCHLNEYEVRHQFSASYTLVSRDTQGDNEWCHINFTEARLGRQRVETAFNDDCPSCDPIRNPLQYAEYSEFACTSTWERILQIRLAAAYSNVGVIESIRFHNGVVAINGRATIEIVEYFSECDWSEQWDNSECEALAIPTCARLNDHCLDGPATRIIEGREVERACWHYETSYRCLTDTVHEEDYCRELRDRGCNQINAHCVAPLDSRCAEYENVYQCPVGAEHEEVVVDCSGQIACMDGNCFDTGYPPNEGIALAATHIAALEEMANDFDADSLTVFGGEDMACSKAVLGFKNCCKGSGWGVDVGLDQCNAEEQQLGLNREASRCRRIGTYCANRDFFGLCTSRHTVYCCFSSKLGRIIQEQGRMQLGMGWGRTRSPDCRGLTPEELQQIDFSAIDFSEFYTDALDNLTPIDRLQLQQELEQTLHDRFDQNN